MSSVIITVEIADTPRLHPMVCGGVRRWRPDTGLIPVTVSEANMTGPRFPEV